MSVWYGILICLLGMTIIASYPAAARATSPPVLLGGTSDMTDLLTESNTDAFRAAGGGLYIQYDGWTKGGVTTSSQRQAIWNIFKSNGDAGAELGTNSTSGWLDAYQRNFVNNGVTVESTSVNGLNAATVPYAKDYIDRFRAAGVKNVTMVATPNGTPSVTVTHPWADSYWDDNREVAMYGGGWTTDSPPKYFFSSTVGQAYRDWIVAQTQWTNNQGLKSIHIISPNSSGANFFGDSVNYVRYFEERSAIPEQWVVENYITPGEPPAGYLNRIGSEDVSTNVAYVANWLINHVQGRPNSLDLYASRTIGGNTTIVGQNVFNPTSSVQNNVLSSSGSQTFTINLKNLGVNAANDFYAPVLSAAVSGAAADWDINFAYGSTDITNSVLNGGYTFQGTNNLLEAGQTRALTLTLTPLGNARGYFNLDLFTKANPSATRYADANSFTLPGATQGVITNPALAFGPDAIDPLAPSTNAGVLDATTVVTGAVSKAQLATLASFGVVQDFNGFTGRAVQGAAAGVPAVNYLSFTDPNRPDVRISSLSGNPSGGGGDSNASTSGVTSSPPAGTDQYLGSTATTGGFKQIIEFGTYNAIDGSFVSDQSVSTVGFMITRINNVATNWTATFYDANNAVLETQTTGTVSGVSNLAALFGRTSNIASIRRVEVTFNGSVNTFMDDFGFTSNLPLLSGDADGDGDVDQFDYEVWRTHFGATGLGASGGDFNLNGMNDTADYAVWRKNYTGSLGAGVSTSVPEPSCSVPLASIMFLFGVLRQGRNSALC